jgi:hypothetical protein
MAPFFTEVTVIAIFAIFLVAVADWYETVAVCPSRKVVLVGVKPRAAPGFATTLWAPAEALPVGDWVSVGWGIDDEVSADDAEATWCAVPETFDEQAAAVSANAAATAAIDIRSRGTFILTEAAPNRFARLPRPTNTRSPNARTRPE